MCSRKHVNFSGQRTDFRNLSSVRTLVVFKNHLTYCLLLEFVYSVINKLNPFRITFLITLCKLVLNLTNIFFTNLFNICKYSLFHRLRRNKSHHIVIHIFRCINMDIFMLRFTALSYNSVNKLYYFLINLMCGKYCFYHLIFRHFISACFNHYNLFSC